ncbi:cobalamin B12-binding domain-containing protein [Desulfovibrio sp. TomC]|uniref:cobalamin B12-binding domain-containing protein n=1 Tax=Desulfovibrio sp. TomC TaxID=1562888 RepID=UPI0005739BCE|nr:cobalamin-dependent protein [Desulfovibrio sp. TomC]KHK01678.1 hypothetical protein NY78_2978 [Desulfovibrio sp. TomC]
MESDLYDSYFQSLVAGDRRACRQIILGLLETDIDIKTLYLSYFQKSLYAIGDLWAANKITVAVEHMATAITESLFPLVYPRIFMADHCGKKAVISCTANEYHQIGGKMVADILELNGWDTIFLGANTPLQSLLDFIDTNQPDMVGLSLSLQDNMPNLLTAIGKIRDRHPELSIIVGGQAFSFSGSEILKATEHVHLIRSFSELEGYIQADAYAT